MLELRDVTKRFGDYTALHPTSLAFAPGKTTVLLGPSGCGKSTLLRLLVGLLAPDGGEVRFDGQAIDPDNLLSIRRRMGYVIQDGGLFPHLTAAENTVLLARYLGKPAEWTKQRLAELAELVHLPENFLTRYPAQLSGGQRQRVSMMRALFLNPDVILLDEPMGALDPMIRSELQAELKRIFAALNKTVVIVTHDIGEGGFLGDTLVLLSAGRIVQQGSLRELVHAPADPFVTQFISAQRSPLDAIGDKS